MPEEAHSERPKAKKHWKASDKELQDLLSGGKEHVNDQVCGHVPDKLEALEESSKRNQIKKRRDFFLRVLSNENVHNRNRVRYECEHVPPVEPLPKYLLLWYAEVMASLLRVVRWDAVLYNDENVGEIKNNDEKRKRVIEIKDNVPLGGFRVLLDAGVLDV